MDFIRTGLEIGRTIKNVSRFREIISILVKNGFDEFLIKTGLHSRIPDFAFNRERVEAVLEKRGEEAKWSSIIGQRLKKSFEELGPSFVKFGQLLASREDFFDKNFIDQMKQLQSQMSPIPFAQLKNKVEKSLGGKVEDYFEYVKEMPVGTASIAVVYRAKTLAGKDVVLKVRRPHIISTIETDFAIVSFIIHKLEKNSDQIRYLGLSRMLEDFVRTIEQEVDFRIEAANCERLKENLKNEKETSFVIPEIFRELTREDLLVMEFLDGTPFSQFKTDDTELKQKVMEQMHVGVRVFVKNLLGDGFYHADLHGGNFMVLRDQRVGIIDFGLMGRLSAKQRMQLVSIIYSMVHRNYENLVYDLLDVADYDKIPNHESLVHELSYALDPIVGLSVKDIDFGRLIKSQVEVLSRYQIYLPRDWYVLFRAMITLDGVGRSLNMDLNIFSVMAPMLDDLMKGFFSKDVLMQEVPWLVKDSYQSLRMLPRYFSWFWRDFGHNNFSLKIKLLNINERLKDLAGSLNFLAFILLISTCLICGTLPLLSQKVEHYRDIGPVSYVFWSLSLLLFIVAFFRKK